MSVETFTSYNAEIEPSRQQLQALSAVLSINKADFFGERGMRIPISGFDDLSVTVGNDGFKLLALSPELNLFSKIYWTREEASFVAPREIDLSKLLSTTITNLEELTGNIEFGQVVIGVMDRVVLSKFRDDIIKEIDLSQDQRDTIYRKIQTRLQIKHGIFLPKYFAKHLSVLKTETGYLFHDLVADNHVEICQFLGIENW